MDDRPLEETTQKQTGLNSFIKKLYRPGPLVFFFLVAFIGLASLGYHLLNESTPPPEMITAKTTLQAAPRIYEEDTSSEMEDRVKQVDLAIIESMRDLKLNMNELDLIDVEIRKVEGRGYHYQVLQLPPLSNRNIFLATLRTRLGLRVAEAVITDNSPNEVAITIHTLPTHRLLLESTPLTLPVPQPIVPKGPKLVIVIDDIGEDMRVLKGLVALNFPVTLAVWPNASFTRAAVELIAQKKRDLIIHFPMEPKGFPRYNPGDDALFVSMSDADIKAQIKANVAKIPEAIGVNNHMGSRFTGDSAKMQIALTEFKQHGLFFLDSLTSGQSVGRSAAHKASIPFYERDIFIDNVKDINAIIHQLKKAENVARKKGFAVAIGHPYKETLAALKKWGSARDSSIRLLPISKLSPEK